MMNWWEEPLHAYAMAIIPEPTKGDGSTLVIYNVDCETQSSMDGRTWCLKNLLLHNSFYNWCLHGEARKHPLSEVWYNQDERYKGLGECLTHSLKWMKEMAVLGDEGLTKTD